MCYNLSMGMFWGVVFVIKFIHTGDLHLGLQFENVSFPKEIANRRRIELWTTFERIVNKAIEDSVDFLFIAGDLFEEKYFTLGDIKRVKDILERAKDINIIISTGNHDTLNKNALYHMIEWPSNISIFDSNSLNKKTFEYKNLCIYGYSWDVAENNKNILGDFKNLDRGKINILLIHGDILDKYSKYLPLDKKHIENIGFDYVALGHIHKPEIFSNKMAYCGSPEPLSFGELGEHGIIQGKISKESTEIEFIPFSQRSFLEKTIKVDENMSYNHIIDAIRGLGNKENFYRIILDGVIDRDINLDIGDLIRTVEDDFYYIEIIDNTIIDYDLDILESENIDNIIGLFISEMKNKNLEDEIIKDAMYIGLEVLMKGKFEL